MNFSKNYICGELYLRSKKVKIAGDELVVTIENGIVPKNLEEVYIVICQDVEESDMAPVVLDINGENYPLLTNSGNNVMSDQLLSPMCYRAIFGNNPSHFLLMDCRGLRCTRFVATPIVAVKGAGKYENA